METSLEDTACVLNDTRHCEGRSVPSNDYQPHSRDLKRMSQCHSVQSKKIKRDVISEGLTTKPILTAQDVSIMVSQDEATLRKLIHDEIISLTKERGMEKSICPSEVARKLFPNGWRSVMQLVRDVGSDLAIEGKIVILQKGQAINPENVRGPIRFRYVQ